MKWYVLNKLGMATLCDSEEDAIASAKEYDMAYPKAAPHVATLMMPVGKGIEQAINDLEIAMNEADSYKRIVAANQIWSAIKWKA